MLILNITIIYVLIKILRQNFQLKLKIKRIKKIKNNLFQTNKIYFIIKMNRLK